LSFDQQARLAQGVRVAQELQSLPKVPLGGPAAPVSSTSSSARGAALDNLVGQFDERPDSRCHDHQDKDDRPFQATEAFPSFGQ
jgi:hypothetical protein